MLHIELNSCMNTFGIKFKLEINVPDLFEKERYTKLLNEIQLLSKHKAEKEGQRTLRSIPLIDLEKTQEIYTIKKQSEKCFKSGWMQKRNISLKIPKEFDLLNVFSNDKHTSQIFNYKWISIEKHSDYDIFYLQSVVNNLKKYGINEQSV